MMKNLKKIKKIHKRNKQQVYKVGLFGRYIRPALLKELIQFYCIKDLPEIKFNDHEPTGYLPVEHIIVYNQAQIGVLRQEFVSLNCDRFYRGHHNFYVFAIAHEFAHVMQVEQGILKILNNGDFMLYKGIKINDHWNHARQPHEIEANVLADMFCESYGYLSAGLGVE